MSKVSFFYRVKTQFDNLGDAVINRMLIDCASNYAAERIIDSSLAPNDFKSQLNLNAENNVNPKFFYLKMILNRIFGHQVYYFLNPGGEKGSITKNQLRKKKLNSLVLKFLNIIGVKLCIFGVSYESLCPYSIEALTEKSRLLYFHGVRDTLSIAYLESLGIYNSKKVPDLAFGVHVKGDLVNEEFRSRIAISLRDEGIDYKNILESLHSALSNQGKFESVIQVKRDYDFMLSIKEKYREIFYNNVISLFDINNAIEYYSSCKLVISNRLHVIILAMLAGSKVLALLDKDSNKKIIGLLRDLNIDNIILYHDGELDREYVQTVCQREQSFDDLIVEQVVETKRIFKEIFDGNF